MENGAGKNKNVPQFLIFLKFLLVVIILIISQEHQSFAQAATISGRVTDDEFSEPLEKAIVQLRGTGAYTITNREGIFRVRLPAADYQFEVIYPGIYSDYYLVSGYQYIYSPMTAVARMSSKYVGRTVQRRFASPLNITNHPKNAENYPLPELLDQSGSTDFNELLVNVPSAYKLDNGGYYGSSELSIRGLDASQTSVVFNGISMNNPETGAMNTPLYTGMSDWAGFVQVQTGQPSGMRSQLGYGGLINTLPFMPYEKAGGSASLNIGNNNYLKASATVNSGLSDENFASVLKVDRTSGEGFAEQTGFESYGMYLNLYKEFTHMHTLLFTTVLKTWQTDMRNQTSSLEEFTTNSFTYNNSWGLLNNTPTSMNKSFGINPMAILSHRWHLRVNTRIVSQLYAEINNSAETYPGGSVNGMSFIQLPVNNQGLAQLDSIYSWNRGDSISSLGNTRIADINNQYINSEYEGFSILAHATKAYRIGLQSHLINDITKQTSLQIGFDAENYQAKHFGALVDLYGADGYISYSDINKPDGFETSNLLKPGFFPKLNSADKVSYNYLATITKGGISGKIETTHERTYWYAEAAASFKSYKRDDYFSYTDESGMQSSKRVNNIGYRFTSGLSYKLFTKHTVSINGAVTSSQPRYYQVFPASNNLINNDAVPENMSSIELSYVVSGGRVYAALKGYGMYLRNHGWLQHNSLNSVEQFAYVYDVDQLHYGAEINSQVSYLRRFTLYASGSWGNWKYQSNAKAKIYDTENELASEQVMQIKGYRISNAPQLSFYLKNEMRLMKSFLINLNYYRAQNLYAPLLVHDFDNSATPDQLKTEWFDRLGIGGSYYHETTRGHTIHFSFDVQNLLNDEYINQIFTNYTETENILNNEVFVGNAQTFRIGLTYSL